MLILARSLSVNLRRTKTRELCVWILQKKGLSTSQVKTSALLNRRTLDVNSTALSRQIVYNQCRFLLETTQIKLINCIEESSSYIDKLLTERASLEERMTTNLENNVDKQEQGKRLNYLNDVAKYATKISRCKSDIQELYQMALELKNSTDTDENDEKMKTLIQEDFEKMNKQLVQLKIELVDLLIPDEVEDVEDATLELSAGVGGAESRLFLTELFEMYRKFAENQDWTFRAVKVDSESSEEIRKAHVEVSGTNAFKYFKFESGVHRVQRVPKTEQGGRVHTSTVGVVVYPKPSAIHIQLNPKDLKIETKTSGGPGGQHANKIETGQRHFISRKLFYYHKFFTEYHNKIKF